jgi:hypothetical protein
MAFHLLDTNDACVLSFATLIYKYLQVPPPHLVLEQHFGIIRPD